MSGDRLAWAEPGVPCVTVDGYGHTEAITSTTTVVRVTKTQVMLTNGARFMRSTGRKHGDGSVWAIRGVRLLAAGDPEVARIRERALQGRIDRTARRLKDAIGLDLLDLRLIAMDAINHPDRTAPGVQVAAERIIAVVGSDGAPAPTEKP